MKKHFLALGFVICLILFSSFVSAALCKGSDGYYHDCDDFYYRDGYRVYDSEFYYDRTKYSGYYEYRNKFGYGYYDSYDRDDYRYKRFEDNTPEKVYRYQRDGSYVVYIDDKKDRYERDCDSRMRGYRSSDCSSRNSIFISGLYEYEPPRDIPNYYVQKWGYRDWESSPRVEQEDFFIYVR